MGWKRWALGAVALGAVTIGIPAGMLASVFVGLTPIADGEVLGPLTTIQDGYVAAFVGTSADGTTFLIDAGNDPEGKAILAALDARGKSASDVRFLFLTHGHQDHIAACPLFAEATVIALAEEAPMVVGEATARGPLPRLVTNDGACRVERAVADGEVVDVGGTAVQAFALPGHTGGSAAWRVGEVLAIGDAASATTGGGLRGAPWLFNDDTPEADASLVDLAARLPAEVTWLAPAHSGPAKREALDAFTPR